MTKWKTQQGGKQKAFETPKARKKHKKTGDEFHD